MLHTRCVLLIFAHTTGGTGYTFLLFWSGRAGLDGGKERGRYHFAVVVADWFLQPTILYNSNLLGHSVRRFVLSNANYKQVSDGCTFGTVTPRPRHHSQLSDRSLVPRNVLLWRSRCQAHRHDTLPSPEVARTPILCMPPATVLERRGQMPFDELDPEISWSGSMSCTEPPEAEWKALRRDCE